MFSPHESLSLQSSSLGLSSAAPSHPLPFTSFQSQISYRDPFTFNSCFRILVSKGSLTCSGFGWISCFNN